MYKWRRIQSDSQTVQDCQAQKIQKENWRNTNVRKKSAGNRVASAVRKLDLYAKHARRRAFAVHKQRFVCVNTQTKSRPVEKMCDMLRVRMHVWHRAETASRRGSYQLWNVMVCGPFSALGNGQLAVIQIWILHHMMECSLPSHLHATPGKITEAAVRHTIMQQTKLGNRSRD